MPGIYLAVEFRTGDPHKELPFTAPSLTWLFVRVLFEFVFFFFLVICISKLGKLDKKTTAKKALKSFSHFCALLISHEKRNAHNGY